MKRKLLVVSLSIMFSAFCFGQAVDLPVDFENTTPNYYGLTDFGGNSSEIIADPTNPSNHVAKTIKTAVAELWAGTTVGGTVGFVNPVPFVAGSTKMSVKVWSPTAGTPIRLKVEDAGNPTISVETEALTTVAAGWDSLVFDFSNQAPGTAAINFANTYNKASIFFNFGTTGPQAGEQTYYWDNMRFLQGTPVQQLNLPVTFENTSLNYGLTDFGGNLSEIITDPANPGNLVAKTIKTAVAELWAGTTVGGTVGFATPVPFVAGSTKMSVKVWSPTAGTPIRLKVEDAGNGTISVETEALTTVAAGWDSLVFDFSNQAPGTAAINFANTYNKASIFFNFGTTGPQAGEQTYYWDNMRFLQTTPVQQLNLPVTFEDVTLDYALTDFGGNSSEIITDPTNPGNLVAKTIKTAVAELWAGTTVGGTVGFAIPIPFVPGSTKMSVKVWSPTAGTPIRLKVEDAGNGTISVETEALTTVAAGWDSLVFDFSNQASGTAAINFANTYNKASIFFNFGTTGPQAGEQTYYWDNMRFIPGTPTGLNLPVTFENTTPDYYALTDFGGNASEIIIDPTNPNNHVAKSIKTGTAELWAGTTVGGTTGFATPIPFTANSKKMSVRVWSPTTGTPIRLKVEASNDPTISVETEANTTVASEWQILVFDFSNQAPGTAALNLANSYNKASIFFNFGMTGAQAGEQTYYWDDMYFGVYTGVNTMNPSDNNVSVYPNPAENILNITSNTTISKVAIYNVSGTQVKESLNEFHQINVSDLANGVYLLRITDINGTTVNTRFIKN
ncbi:MAG: T9SS type A sorting domain-containing protein [Bacteroidales bacterium]